ncbi:MAG: four helix bundle protein [Flavobacteriaceae bacterium CG_4_8_14_3_um_filter_34_10]|nr:four helix bundle protein [Flavobacteriia bacterium]PIQ19114.1 MAG: four helix bundle protein [Flavobacteriaceae bacterium CG18_big_fil_WC_8_21_14_2_50_34_36]PIV51828.1 MAG: four helix bundle protein [Flavobacteriaceae bacterium CG02_land_8_20_14_3_00_34_13]PIX09644.1 MAG: four helix bundle protein [Flavobacteriaceae bacterium CG_4_8_14_3_um_filter_34_10]PIZ07675.1 MAG: four helix bundle protein [Flavobacteriaceae bacterium CG_4_10_14_0_8_um_filter_34_31]PJC07618.1 MAG: four helix bundle pr
MALSYRELDMYQIAFDLFIKTHNFSLELPKHELYELGSQLRRSSGSVNSNIVEGYGRKTYKNDFIKFLIYAHTSDDETSNHLKKLQILYPQFDKTIIELLKEYDILGAKIYKFKEYVIKSWKT